MYTVASVAILMAWIHSELSSMFPWHSGFITRHIHTSSKQHVYCCVLLSNHYNLQAPVGLQFIAVVCSGGGGDSPGRKLALNTLWVMHISWRYNNTHCESWQWLMKNNSRWEWISSMKQNKPDAQRIARNVYSFSLFECPKIFMCFLHEVHLMEYNATVISTCLYISPPKLNWFQLNLVQEIVIYPM